MTIFCVSSQDKPAFSSALLMPLYLPFNYHIIIFSFIYSVLIKATLKGVQGGLHILNVEAKPNTGDLYF